MLLRLFRLPPRMKMRSELFDQRKVAVDDGIHQGIEHVARPAREVFGFALATGAHVGDVLTESVLDRDDITVSGKNVHVADLQTALFVLGFLFPVRALGVEVAPVSGSALDRVFLFFEQVHDGEQFVVVFLDLGALVSVGGVFDR